MSTATKENRQGRADGMADEEDNTEQKGLRCPKCGCCDLRVRYSELKPQKRQRVRYCRACGRRVVTHEKIIGQPPASPDEKSA